VANFGYFEFWSAVAHPRQRREFHEFWNPMSPHPLENKRFPTDPTSKMQPIVEWKIEFFARVPKFQNPVPAEATRPIHQSSINNHQLVLFLHLECVTVIRVFAELGALATLREIFPYLYPCRSQRSYHRSPPVAANP